MDLSQSAWIDKPSFHRPISSRITTGLLLLVLSTGCGKSSQRESDPKTTPSTAHTATLTRAATVAATDPAQTYSFEPQLVHPEQAGLHNLIQVSDQLYSGSEPEGDEGFSSLAKLGIKTIISVDGLRPNLESATKHSLRYVHIPIGYDGIPDTAAAALRRAAAECVGPIYVHCHHGKHRGPAATAVVCMAAQHVTTTDAERILNLAGTGKEYAGLWRDVGRYPALSFDGQPPELVEVAKVDSLASLMANLDRHWDQLKLCREASWTSPASHPDLVPLNEAVLVREFLQEGHRMVAADAYDPQFHTTFTTAESIALELENNLKLPDSAAATTAMSKLETSCKQCHTSYRNTPTGS